MSDSENGRKQGDRLREFLQAANVRNKELAESLGVSPNYISMLIKGTKPINDKLLFNLTKVLPKLNQDWLIKGEGDMFLKNNGSGETSIDALMDDKISCEVTKLRGQIDRLWQNVNLLNQSNVELNLRLGKLEGEKKRSAN